MTFIKVKQLTGNLLQHDTPDEILNERSVRPETMRPRLHNYYTATKININQRGEAVGLMGCDLVLQACFLST